MPSGSRYNDGNFMPWGERDWAKGDALKGWEDFYGYAGQYKPGEQKVDPTVADDYGTGFGPGDLRRATNRGYSATSIMNYMSGHDGGGGYAGIIPQEVKNQLRARMATEEALYTGWNKYKDKFSGLQTAQDTLRQEGVEGRRKNSEEIAEAMTEAQKVRQNNPYAVTGNTAMGIQQAQSPNQVARQISAGLAGFSRNQKKFKTKTLNV